MDESLDKRIMAIMAEENARLAACGLRWEQPDGWTEQTGMLMMLTHTPQRVDWEQANPARRKVTLEYPPEEKFMTAMQVGMKAAGLPPPLLGGPQQAPRLESRQIDCFAMMNAAYERLAAITQPNVVTPEQQHQCQLRMVQLQSQLTVQHLNTVIANMRRYTLPATPDQLQLIIAQAQVFLDAIAPSAAAAAAVGSPSASSGAPMYVLGQPVQVQPMQGQGGAAQAYYLQSPTFAQLPPPSQQTMGDASGSSQEGGPFCTGCGVRRMDSEALFCVTCGKRYE